MRSEQGRPVRGGALSSLVRIRWRPIAMIALLLGSTAVAQTPANAPVIFTFDDPRDGLWVEAGRRVRDVHVAERVPIVIAYVPCGWRDGVESTNDPYVCRNEPCDGAEPGLHCELGDWVRANPTLIEIAQHGLTHDFDHEQLAQKSREEQRLTISRGLEEMATWDLPEPPLTFAAPFSSLNADTVSVLEELGFHTGIKSAGTCAFSTNLEVFCNSVPLCELGSDGGRVTGPDCVLRSPDALVAAVDQKVANAGRAFLIYHAQDLYMDDLVTIDEQKVAELRAILERFRSEEVAGRYDLMTNEAYYQLVRQLPSPGAQGSPVDFDGDGLSDVSVYRPSTGEWILDFNRDGGTDRVQKYGGSADIPIPMDYDGDGVSGFAIYRPSWGAFYVDTDRNGGTDFVKALGGGGDIPVPGDYDGDEVTDLAVFDPQANEWSLDTNRDGVVDLTVVFGQSGDVPIPGDFNGDGTTDFALWRAGNWILDTDRNGVAEVNLKYGGASDIPVAADYDGDGRTDLAIYRTSWGAWYVDTNLDGGTEFVTSTGTGADPPVPGDFDGDRITDLAVFVRSTHAWKVDTGRDGSIDFQTILGADGDIPLRHNGWVLDATGTSP